MHIRLGANIGLPSACAAALLLTTTVASADWLTKRLHDAAQIVASVPELLTPAPPKARHAPRKSRRKARPPHRGNDNINVGDLSQVTTIVRSNIGQTLSYAATGVEGAAGFVATIGSGASRIPGIIGSNVPAPSVAAALAAAIRSARAVHYPQSRPLPRRIIAILSKTMPMAALKRARYTEGDLNITLPNLVNGAQKYFAGNDHAVVVDDVIVFTQAPGTQSPNDIKWWAHEIHHVYQYKVWGVDRFAAKYVNNSGRIEKRAEQVANRAVARMLALAQRGRRGR